jgi:dimeric dUTPase (all-alpha-NTP-PPase superfamily)
MIIDLADIFIKQKELDLTIQAKRQTTYQLTLNEIKLALIVELAELANEVRSFKF